MQSTLAVVLAVVGLPFLGAALTPLVHRVLGERTAHYATAVALACLGLVVHLRTSGATGTVAVEWVPSLGVSLAFHVDGLALLVALLASGVGVLVFVYSAGYMHGERALARYYATMLAFMGSMLGVALAGDLVALFVFWELTSVTSFLLIGHHSETAASRYAARKSMLVTVAGGLFMLVGFVLLAWGAGRTGAETYLIADLVARAPEVRAGLREAGLLLPVLGLVGLGAAAKSAQVPLHFWLPDAMAAPTPVSAFLHSATMVKAGVYLVGRLRPLLLPADPAPLSAWTLLFATLGLVTMTVTAVLAVLATDVKELLAYSTASHLGLIVAGFGLANAAGAEAGVLHVLNHASFKAACFFVAGIVAHAAGTRELADLGGLRRDLPVTAAVATVAGLSMAGVPPFNGFYSKEFLFEATVEAAGHAGGAAWLLPAVATLGSAFTVVYSLRFVGLFWGDRPAGLADGVERPSTATLLPAVALGLLVLALSLVPDLAVDPVVGDAVAATVAGDAPAVSVHLPTTLSLPVGMSAVAVVLGAGGYAAVDPLRSALGRPIHGPVAADWWYDGAVDGLTAASRLATPLVQTGNLRTYVTWVLGTTATLALVGYAAAGVAVPLPTGLGPGVTVPVVLVAVVAVVAAGAVVVAPSHVAGVLTLSVLGFMLAILYVLADAPDLALTQIVVETLILVIFLLVIHRLPAYYGDSPVGRQVRDVALAGVVGLVVTVTVLLTTAASPDDAVARYLLDRAGVPPDHGAVVFDWGGGGNVVNVILVDFRALDTLGEISVVAMAAVGVLTLVRMRGRGEHS